MISKTLLFVLLVCSPAFAQRMRCGDFDGDGDVDSIDRTNQTVGWTGALKGGGGATFASGDCDGDEDVDTADQIGLIGQWTCARPAFPMFLGLAELIYDPTTGNVTLDASQTGSGEFVSFVLATEEGDMLPNNLLLGGDDHSPGPFSNTGTNTDLEVFQIGQTAPLKEGIGPVIELGNVFPADISSVEELGDYLTLANYASEFGIGGRLHLRMAPSVVPEPTTILLLVLGLLFCFIQFRNE